MIWIDPDFGLQDKYIEDTFKALGIPLTKPSIKFVSLVIAHLHLANKQDRDNIINVSLSNTEGYSRAGMSKLIDYLEYHGYIKQVKGNIGTNTKLFLTEGVDNLPFNDKKVGIYTSDNVIYQNSGKSTQKIDLSAAPSIIKEKNRRLISYSELLDSHSITLGDKEIETGLIKSIYGKDYHNHGRIYGLWQCIKSTDRNRILISGKHTTELDFSCMGVSIAYNLHGSTLKKDAYGFKSGLSRSDNKKIMSIALNTKSRRSAILAIESNLPDCKDPDKVLTQVENYHLRIKGSLYSELGMKLMNIDSKVCEEIIRRCNSESLPILSIHDGFIVDTDKSDTLKCIMEESYERVLKNKSPTIK